MSALPGRRFERALTRAASRAGVALAIEEHDERAWNSATFSGARHVLHASAIPDAALTRWLERLGEEELDVPGHLVADLQLGACARRGDLARFCVTGLTLRQH